jgi:hypothetical protein
LSKDYKLLFSSSKSFHLEGKSNSPFGDVHCIETFLPTKAAHKNYQELELTLAAQPAGAVQRPHSRLAAGSLRPEPSGSWHFMDMMDLYKYLIISIDIHIVFGY